MTYPASATAQSAEFASADCVTGLNEIGQISVSNILGDPQDVERIVALKADEQGASWYRIYYHAKASSLITGVYRRYCMRESDLQQMNNAGCGASALSGLQIFTYFIELIETSVASVVYAYKHAPSPQQ